MVGLETFQNGDVYFGHYEENKFHGEGYLINKKQGYEYQGTFRNGKKEGYGKETYPSGGYYQGQFKDNKKHGKGKLHFTDQTVYEGEFQNGTITGFGVL